PRAPVPCPRRAGRAGRGRCRRPRRGGRAMTDLAIGAIALFGLVTLIYGGVHVAVALAACSFMGVFAMTGNPQLAGRMLALAASESIDSYIFGVVPLFVLMGFIVSQADVGR